MRRVAQAPSHYEVELRQPNTGNGRSGTVWRAVRRIAPDGAMTTLTFSSLEAAQAHAERLKPKEARIVVVERDGWRWTVDAAET